MGQAHISGKCYSAPSTALLVLGNPYHKGPIENSVKADMASSPVHFLPSLALVTPIAKSKVAVTPQHRCGRKCKNKQN